MIILLDCDDVLAQFTQGVIDVLNAKGGYDFDINDVTDWDMAHSLGISNNAVFGIAGEEDFCTNLNMMPGAQEAVRELEKLGEIYIVTSPIWSSRTWMFERTRWLYEHFGIQANHVIHTSAKHLVYGDFFIDDRLSHVEKWWKFSGWDHNRHGYVLDVPWPRTREEDCPLYLDNWDQVIEKVKKAKKAKAVEA